MTHDSDPALPLHGKTALVTGVSRRRGIGYAIATHLAGLGASVFIQHFAPHDAALPWGSDDLEAVRAGLRGSLRPGAVSGDLSADLRDVAAVEALVDAASALTGRLDILICNHAQSGGDGSILDMTADRLDSFWQVNTRSTILLTQRFARLRAAAPAPGTTAPAAPGTRRAERAAVDERQAGRVIWMTSGQGDGPMRGEVAYAASKAALAGVTATVAAELLDLGIVLNTIDPGPVNTGYLDAETADRPLEAVSAWVQATPFGRFGAPADAARLIGWLCTDSGVWVVGQVLKTDGGLSLG
ncbi:SDR family oxidoreductase [Microterricola viridarii]|uniref:3-oxoacyl-[acyl-carrier protein] reductase n=1 Tax=Microterricola viridarii TaxID=412690 RepID=A0A1H1RL41_9MICO|nr:SDR family oxidoreductase [Microterricola viridarii]SDS36408.1 3-oxoacyl-[acyl-carrier protein] reductase [Microterricola viridarii]